MREWEMEGGREGGSGRWREGGGIEGVREREEGSEGVGDGGREGVREWEWEMEGGRRDRGSGREGGRE